MSSPCGKQTITVLNVGINGFVAQNIARLQAVDIVFVHFQVARLNI